MSVYVTDQSQFPRRIRFDWIGEAFSIYGKNAGVWIGVTLITLVLGLGLGFVCGAYNGVISTLTHPGTIPAPMSPVSMLIYYPLSILLSSFFYAGEFKMANKAVRGEQISIGDLFSGGNVILPVIGYNILFVIAVFAGTLLCVLPVFVVYAALWPGYAMVADGEGVGAAFSRSWNAVKQDWLNAALFSFVLILLVIASEIPVFLGLFVTIPMLFIIGSLMYRDMVGMPGAGAEGLGGPYYAAPNTAGGVWPPAPTPGVPPQNNPFPPMSNPSNAFPPASDPYAPPSNPPQERE